MRRALHTNPGSCFPRDRKLRRKEAPSPSTRQPQDARAGFTPLQFILSERF